MLIQTIVGKQADTQPLLMHSYYSLPKTLRLQSSVSLLCCVVYTATKTHRHGYDNKGCVLLTEERCTPWL